jgi:hypothetical protein
MAIPYSTGPPPNGILAPGVATVNDAINYLAGSENFNVKSFGAIGDGVADDTAPIQNAINACSFTGGRVYIPRGVYNVSRLFLCHTASNTGYSTDPQRQGRVILYGDGCGSHQNLFDPLDYSGTVIISTQTAGNMIVVSTNIAGSSGRLIQQNIVISDMVFISDTKAGQILRFNNVNTATTIERVIIYARNSDSDATPTALWMDSVFNITFRDMYIQGFNRAEDSTRLRTGTGIRLVITDEGGGNQLFENITVSHFDKAWDLGETYISSIGNTRGYKNFTTINCQARQSHIGMVLKHRMVGFTAINMWFESNVPPDANVTWGTSGDIIIKEAAGWDSFPDRAGASLMFVGCILSSNTTNAYYANVIIGDGAGGTASTTGPIRFLNTIWNGIRTTGIYRYNTPTSAPVVFDNCSFQLPNTGIIDCFLRLETNSPSNETSFVNGMNTNIPNSKLVVYKNGSGVDTDARTAVVFVVPGLRDTIGLGTVPSAKNLTYLTQHGNYLRVTGTVGVGISSISKPVTVITRTVPLTIMFLNGCTVKNNVTIPSSDSVTFAPIKLNGNQDYVAGPNWTLTLLYEPIGQFWMETARSTLV